MNQLDYYQEVHKYYKKEITLPRLTQWIQEGKPVIFVKYGDGEVECMEQSGKSQHNCDRDIYFPALGEELKLAFCEYVLRSSCSKHPIYIGKWHFSKEIDYLSKIAYNTLSLSPLPPPLIPFTDYHLLMNDKAHLQNRDLFNLVKTIQETNLYTKIVVSNPQNQLLESLFRADAFITTPASSLYLEIDRIMEEIEAKIEDRINRTSDFTGSRKSSTPQEALLLSAHPSDEPGKLSNILFITSCGLSAKVIIYRLLRKYGNHISALDFGSSFDLLCKKCVTRTYQQEYSYEEIFKYYHDIL